MKAIGSLVMSADCSARRFAMLTSILSPGRRSGIRYVTVSADQKFVSIGDVSVELKKPQHPELVPVKYKLENPPQSLLKHLRWIMQKDLLGQDVFLIGPPGPLRRNVAMMYLEMTQKEVEYVSLSRDTTEMDLKQRREICAGSAIHLDQCAVRAATDGRVLILEGIEKAERNVLPVLNNLLENREMQLDDGRFLMAASRYDKLLQDHTKEELDAWKLVRVHEDFRVIALGLPVPRYQGNPLDPPLRSRFQARDIHPIPFKDHLQLLETVGKGRVPSDSLLKILSFATTMISDETHSLGLPDFPIDNLYAIVRILQAVPSSSIQRLLERLYPHQCMLGNEGQTAVKNALKSFELIESTDSGNRSSIAEIRVSAQGGAAVQLQCGHSLHEIKVLSGTLEPTTESSLNFVSTPFHDEFLADMMQSHLVKDFCIIGPRGCGKSILVRQFADLLGYHVEPIMLYQDMTARDLLQQRTTTPSGDTSWRLSPLVVAALEGSLAVLDGVHRVNAGTFAVLHRLIHDRELSLFDGTRLLRHDRYDEIQNHHQLTDEAMKARGLLRIHPSFRIVALSEPPVIGSSSQQWLNAEQLTMFLFHHMRSMSVSEELHVLSKLVPHMPDMQKIMDWTHKLRESADTSLKSVAASLSTRQLLRIARRLTAYPDENLYDVLQKACLARFLPRLTRTAFEEELNNLGIVPTALPHSVDGVEKSITCGITDGVLRIGNTTVPVFNPENKTKVPDVLFYENAQHLAVMEDMLKDFLLGEHLLLIGNQGVGKNKIVDRFLYLLNRPREYLQLHRDTTVQTLTLQPTVHDGVIVYEDSPLVRAIKLGHVLVVDEADKAPTNVTCILKTLVESGEMHLADGRRIVSASSGRQSSASVIVAHPDFRMFVLANRPGFPFLGNDFFGAMGDTFSCHAVDNPDVNSEMAMLQQYGPHVPEETLRRLVLAFGELRTMADQGLISYPYSTREVVNMVRHLEKFPGEGLVNVVSNVFDFDSYNKELQETILETLHKHGIPIGANPQNLQLAKEYPLPPLQLAGEWIVQKQGMRKRTKLFSCPVEEKQLRVKGPLQMNIQSFPVDRTEARSTLFSEQEAFWNIPLHEISAIVDIAVTEGAHRQPGQANSDVIHVATTSPVTLYSMDTRRQHMTCIDLYDVFPGSTTRNQSYRPHLHLAPLGFPLDSNIVMHEELMNTVLSINWETGKLVRLEFGGVVEAAAGKIARSFRAQQGVFKMVSDLSQEQNGRLLFYKQDSDSIDIVDMFEGRYHSVSLPVKIRSLSVASQFDWVLTATDTNRKYLLSHTADDPFEFTLQIIEENISSSTFAQQQNDGLDLLAVRPLSDLHLSAAIGKQIQSPSRVFATPGLYSAVAVGFPDCLSSEVYVCPRHETVDTSSVGDKVAAAVYETLVTVDKPASRGIAYLPESGQVARLLNTSQVPKEILPKGVKPSSMAAYLEITDIVNKNLRYIPVPSTPSQSVYNQWYYAGIGATSHCGVLMAPMSNDGLVTVDSSGCVRLWETAMFNLTRSLSQWRNMIGENTNRPLQVTYEKELGKTPTMPKHGQIDPTGAPHVGGSNFAGGSGGMNTAGLGGIGGPYRLDSGNPVFQVADWEKAQVPEEVLRAARELAERAWKERLRQIKMSEFDAELYERFASSVRLQVKSLRVILDTLQAKGKERQWLKHQMYGDLDEAKLIEGLTGERGIYKRRGEKEPELGSPQQKPKRIRLLCDVSGSMYRFNGQDGRLDRQLETILMVMEAFESFENKIKYEVYGHSGEGYSFPFVNADSPPKNMKERLDILLALHAHSQFCISGDNTLEAAKHAIESIIKEDADEHFVIVLSDANLERYGIRPKKLSEILTMNDEVNAYTIFIGSLGDQAHRIMKQMPSGRAFLCLDTKNLPSILQQIFTSTMLSTR